MGVPLQLKPTKGVVIVGHDIGEGVRYISTSDDYLGFSGLVCQLYDNVQKSYDYNTWENACQ